MAEAALASMGAGVCTSAAGLAGCGRVGKHMDTLCRLGTWGTGRTLPPFPLAGLLLPYTPFVRPFQQ